MSGCISPRFSSGDLYLDNITIFDPIRVSDPDIGSDLKNFLWRVTELSVVGVRPEDERFSAKYPAGGHAHRDSPAIFFLLKSNCILWRWKDCIAEVEIKCPWIQFHPCLLSVVAFQFAKPE